MLLTDCLVECYWPLGKLQRLYICAEKVGDSLLVALTVSSFLIAFIFLVLPPTWSRGTEGYRLGGLGAEEILLRFLFFFFIIIIFYCSR